MSSLVNKVKERSIEFRVKKVKMRITCLIGPEEAEEVQAMMISSKPVADLPPTL